MVCCVATTSIHISLYLASPLPLREESALIADQLHSYLRRLNLERNTVLPYATPDTKEDLLTLDKYLDLLAKQNYLEKTRIPAPDGAEENATIEWRWGAREAEFSQVAAAQFIVDV